MPHWVAKEKIGTLLLASEMPVPIPRNRTVCVFLDVSIPTLTSTLLHLWLSRETRKYQAKLETTFFIANRPEDFANMAGAREEIRLVHFSAPAPDPPHLHACVPTSHALYGVSESSPAPVQVHAR